jgi:microcystin-dependent protein
LLPDSNNTRDIGRSDLRFRRMYATTFFGNLEGIVSGNVTGKSGSADKLTSATTFRLQGDVETVEQSFDGQTGGGTKAFDVTIKNSLISGKTLVTSSQGDDEFIVNRTVGETGLKRISRATLFDSINGLTPIGSIMPYAGTTEPAGWKFCNGQELSQGSFSALFTVIGLLYTIEDDTTSGYFRVPDLQGRFPLGNLAMGGDAPAVEVDDTRARDDNAQTLGAVDGSDEVSIGVDNLPEHQHDMKDPSGRQFYAYREEIAPGTNPDGVSDANVQTGPDLLTERLSNSGGVDTISAGVSTLGENLNVMNPYLTINYIIYTGKTGS